MPLVTPSDKKAEYLRNKIKAKGNLCGIKALPVS